MSAGARWFVLGLGAATFIVAAKAHGQQVRLERELAGYWEVTFGGRNPAFVAELWRRERLLFWSVALGVALVTVGFRVLAPRFGWPLPVEGGATGRSFVGALFLHVLVPSIVAFVATGLLSVARFAFATRSGAAASGAHPHDWLSSALWGSAGWWFLTFAMGTALCALAWRHPS